MYLVRLKWRSASESKLVYSRYSRLSQAWRTAKPIRIISAVSKWFRRRTSHELNSFNSIRLMWSTASEPGQRQLGKNLFLGTAVSNITFAVSIWLQNFVEFSCRFLLLKFRQCEHPFWTIQTLLQAFDFYQDMLFTKKLSVLTFLVLNFIE